ncbi:hypothetical protein QFZ81_003617 [Paenibacillus sp. V4I9]|nr:hypothetical protein [Paenibacillus sp. V4I9]
MGNNLLRYEISFAIERKTNSAILVVSGTMAAVKISPL